MSLLNPINIFFGPGSVFNIPAIASGIKSELNDLAGTVRITGRDFLERRFPLYIPAIFRTPQEMAIYERYMYETLKVSEESIQSGNSPFAAIVVDPDGKIISRAHNTVPKSKDPSAHAEMNAVRAACKKLHLFWLTGYTVYTTNEPCPMCFSLLNWARIDRMVYGQPVSFAKKYGFNEDDSSIRKRSKTKIKIVPNILPNEVALQFQKWSRRQDKVLY